MSTEGQATDSRFTTKEGWRRFLVEFCDHTTKQHLKEDEFAVAHLVIQQDPRTGDRFAQPHMAVIGTRFSGNTPDEVEESKQFFHRTVRCHAVAGDALASLFVSEIWRSIRIDDGGPHCEPRLDPNREECIMVMADHLDFGRSGHTAVIHPEGEQRRIDPWLHEYEGEPTADGDIPSFGGRMMSFVPPRSNDLSRKAAVLIARAYLQDLEHKKQFVNVPAKEPVP